MESLTHILTILATFSPVGVMAVMALAIVLLVWKNPLTPIQSSIDKIKDNHLSHVEADMNKMADGISDMAATLQRIEMRLAEDLSYVKMKVSEK